MAAKKASDYKFRHVPNASRQESRLISETEREMGGRLTENSLSGEQHAAFNTICHWYEKHDSDLITLGGYAGCLSGSTMLAYNRGARAGVHPISLRDLYLKFNGYAVPGVRGASARFIDLTLPTHLESMWPDGTVALNRVVGVLASGTKKVIRITFDDGAALILTEDHPIAIPGGEFIAAGSLALGDRVLGRGSMRPIGEGQGRRPIDQRPAYLRERAVVTVVPAGEEETYDVQMEPPANNFVANGIIVHNTGKSTLISTLANKYEAERIAFCAFTGQATNVLRRKLSEAGATTRHTVSTLHSLLYRPVTSASGGVSGWIKKTDLAYDLFVVDEASMLNQDLYNDLRSYGIPILAVGDHGQIPPVFGNLSLMENPHLRLETIHRQAQDSPILALSEFVRKTGQIPRMEPSAEVQVLEMSQMQEIVQSLFTTPGIHYDDVALLCYRNETRVGLNNTARVVRWGAKASQGPQPEDQVICLKNTEATIFNGMRGIVKFVKPQGKFTYEGRVLFESDEIEVTGSINAPQFGRPGTYKDFDEFAREHGYRPTDWGQMGLLLDYGYALTVHKAQGSQFEHVVVMAERPGRQSFDDWKRWLYTAITRCSKYLVVLQ